MKDKKVNKKTTKKIISTIVTYYMPIKLLNEVKILAERLGVTIKEIKIEDKDVRFYCVGHYKLLDTFNKLRVELLDPVPISENGK